MVLPSSPQYATDSQLYNERFDGIDPAAIAYCQSPTDVQHCVNFARQHGVQVAARSGGHSYGGYSTCTGLVVDVTQMSTVAVASGGQSATIGGGALLIDVYNQLNSAGVLVPGGSCPTVGIAGLALGGGIGVLGRKYGLTCDNITALQIVTADGKLLTCDANTNADLYWACRGGGGGNFGIVTSFTFTVFPIPDLCLFTINWPWAQAASVLGAWQQWMPGTPDEVWSNCQLLSGGSGSGLSLRVAGVYVGDQGGIEAQLQPLLAAVGSAPSSQFVGPESYLNAMLIEAGCEGSSVAACHLPTQNPAGTLSRSAFAAKSAYVSTAFPANGIDAVVSSVESLLSSVPQMSGGVVFDSCGGAIANLAPDATAYVHRQAQSDIQYSVTWPAGTPQATIDTGTAWLTQAQSTLAPFVNGQAYVNYIDPTISNGLQAYYGTNLARLVSVKKQYDPDNFFHFAQSIPTTLS